MAETVWIGVNTRGSLLRNTALDAEVFLFATRPEALNWLDAMADNYGVGIVGDRCFGKSLVADAGEERFRICERYLP